MFGTAKFTVGVGNKSAIRAGAVFVCDFMRNGCLDWLTVICALARLNTQELFGNQEACYRGKGQNQEFLYESSQRG